ncbi:hypothetical protein NDU88_001734 [Pleurodeles waltl]|uniref:Uncharacterized protein n=1 Tax=Pleurodeles waltl TaxID=8319 RepID=A0AAV7RDV4_PLEWA|nr:hypothetical protein NDU88_001734 [Pleurodeles waltl]
MDGGMLAHALCAYRVTTTRTRGFRLQFAVTRRSQIKGYQLNTARRRTAVETETFKEQRLVNEKTVRCRLKPPEVREVCAGAEAERKQPCYVVNTKPVRICKTKRCGALRLETKQAHTRLLPLTTRVILGRPTCVCLLPLGVGRYTG